MIIIITIIIIMIIIFIIIIIVIVTFEAKSTPNSEFRVMSVRSYFSFEIQSTLVISTSVISNNH